MTYLEIVNEVLERLREDPVTAVSENDYSTLIGNFVNKAKEKVENAWTWQRLRTTIQVTTSSGVYAYSLTGAGKRFKVLWDNESDMPDVFNDTDDMFLRPAPSGKWMSSRLNEDNIQNQQPTVYDINGYDASYDPVVNLYPVPDSVTRVINFNLYVPQEKLTADATVLLCPDRPVIEYAYLYGLSERGEDNGTFYQEQKEEAKTFLGEEIDREYMMYPDNTVWSPT